MRALARASRLLERASGDLSLAHYRVLAAVASGEERASRVAARLALGRPAISAAVDSLGQRGLLDRVEVEGDARAVALSVTAAGQRVLAQAEARDGRTGSRTWPRAPRTRPGCWRRWPGSGRPSTRFTTSDGRRGADAKEVRST